MIFIFIVTIVISVILHELAHVIVAKAFGCRIEELSFGFGKTLYERKYKQIKYKIKILPFGGDCQLMGERKYSRAKEAFCNLSYRKKVGIGLAGCAVNLILGLIGVLLGIHFMNQSWFIFGFLNIALGCFNLLPIPPLDASYLVFIWLEKLYGKVKGYNRFIKINAIALQIFNIINLLSIPLCIYWYWIGLFR